MKITNILASMVAVLLFSSSAMAQQFKGTGKIIHIASGDTVTLLLEGGIGEMPVTVALSSTDAPETEQNFIDRLGIGQPHSENSKMFLASMVLGKVVDASCFEQAKSGRYICELFVNGKSVNQEMVKQGWAWANVASNGRHLRDKTLPDLEKSARSNRSGLWASSNPVPPWVWRDTCWKKGTCPQ